MFLTPLNFSVEGLQDNRKMVFIIFHVTLYTSLHSSLTSGGSSGPVIEIPSNTETTPLKCAFDMLLSASRKECVPDRKTEKKRDIAQYNTIIKFLEDNNYMVQRCDINDFIEMFSTVIWDIDPHLSKFQSRNISLPNAVIENFST